jgi:hypothetical protein
MDYFSREEFSAFERLQKNPQWNLLKSELSLKVNLENRLNAVHNAILLLNGEGVTGTDPIVTFIFNLCGTVLTSDVINAAIDLLEVDNPPRVKVERRTWQNDDGRGYSASGQYSVKIVGIRLNSPAPKLRGKTASAFLKKARMTDLWPWNDNAASKAKCHKKLIAHLGISRSTAYGILSKCTPPDDDKLIVKKSLQKELFDRGYLHS